MTEYVKWTKSNRPFEVNTATIVSQAHCMTDITESFYGCHINFNLYYMANWQKFLPSRRSELSAKAETRHVIRPLTTVIAIVISVFKL